MSHPTLGICFLARFEQAYDPARLSRGRQVESVGAVHHRLLWIHPFLDGNGRVTRLMSHALFKRLGLGTSLWSVSRGLARDAQRYATEIRLGSRQRAQYLNLERYLADRQIYKERRSAALAG